MTHPWDEFSKSLAESVPRRETLRRLGFVFAGAALSPFALPMAWAKGPDVCKRFCNQCPTWARSQCLAACQACNGNTNQLCGACGSFACCSNSGLACCSGVCVDVFEDFYNCGGCGIACDEPGLYEEGACVDGTCMYQCVQGATRCNGTCTILDWDPNNCGACGNVCPSSAPYCQQGQCVCPSGMAQCGGECVDIMFDASNCGGCGQACPTGHVCSAGACCNPTISDCFGSSDPCVFPFISCGGVCVDPTSDPYNCGGCGIQCGESAACISGFCESY